MFRSVVSCPIEEIREGVEEVSVEVEAKVVFPQEVGQLRFNYVKFSL